MGNIIKNQNPFEGKLDDIISDNHPCDSEEEIKATIAINEEMEMVQSNSNAKKVMSKMAVKDFVFTS